MIEINKITFTEIPPLIDLIRFEPSPEMILDTVPYSGEAFPVFKTAEFQLFLYKAAIKDKLKMGSDIGEFMIVPKETVFSAEDYIPALSSICRNVFRITGDVGGFQCFGFKFPPSELLERFFSEGRFSDFLFKLYRRARRALHNSPTVFYDARAKHSRGDLLAELEALLGVSRSSGKFIPFPVLGYSLESLANEPWFKGLCGKTSGLIVSVDGAITGGIYLKS